MLVDLDDLVEPDAKGDPMCPVAVDDQVACEPRRLFTLISMNWRGKPPTDIATIIELISARRVARSSRHGWAQEQPRAIRRAVCCR